MMKLLAGCTILVMVSSNAGADYGMNSPDFNNRTQRVMSYHRSLSSGLETGEDSNEKPLAGVAEAVKALVDPAPTDHRLVKLMEIVVKDSHGDFPSCQFHLKLSEDDYRQIYVGALGSEIIILGYVHIGAQKEGYYFLTSPRAELRSVVYGHSAASAQIMKQGDTGYASALKEFNSQVEFWISKEEELRNKLKIKVPGDLGKGQSGRLRDHIR